jgi:RNA recognition motif-containing protein
MELLSNNWIDSVSIDVEKANQIIRLLDAAVIKLEGGTDFDLKALDENFEEEKAKEPDLSLFSVDVEKPQKPIERKASETENGDESLDDRLIKDQDNEDNDTNAKEVNDKELSEKENEVEENENPETTNIDSMEEGEASCDANSESKTTLEEEKPKEIDQNSKVEEKDESPNKSTKSNVEKPRPLHKTASIFLRNLAPSITKQEIEDVMNIIIELNFKHISINFSLISKFNSYAKVMADFCV